MNLKKKNICILPEDCSKYGSKGRKGLIMLLYPFGFTTVISETILTGHSEKTDNVLFFFFGNLIKISQQQNLMITALLPDRNSTKFHK